MISQLLGDIEAAARSEFARTAHANPEIAPPFPIHRTAKKPAIFGIFHANPGGFAESRGVVRRRLLKTGEYSAMKKECAKAASGGRFIVAGCFRAEATRTLGEDKR